jgi:hypothetical protein
VISVSLCFSSSFCGSGPRSSSRWGALGLFRGGTRFRICFPRDTGGRVTRRLLGLIWPATDTINVVDSRRRFLTTVTTFRCRPIRTRCIGNSMRTATTTRRSKNASRCRDVGQRFFQRKVRLLFVQHCYSFHAKGPNKGAARIYYAAVVGQQLQRLFIVRDGIGMISFAR